MPGAACMAMTLLYTVRRSLAAEVVTLHNSRESATLADSRYDVNSFATSSSTLDADVLADFDAFGFPAQARG